MKAKTYRSATSGLMLLCLYLPGYTQSISQIKKASVIIQNLQEQTLAAGIVVSVGIKNQIVWSQGFGYADVEQQVAINPAKTLFRVGSIAKPITATALAQLYEQGLLDWEAPIQRYVPTFPKKRAPITTRQLSGHLAGIRHYKDGEFFNAKHYDTVLEGLNIFQDDSLLFIPGSKYSYTSYGYNLLSAVLEGASGQDYLTYMSQNIFQPAGMMRTIADHVDSVIVGRGRYYVVRGGVLLNAPAVDNSYKWAGGGLLSTSEDLVRFAFGYFNNKLLKAETIQLLWTSQKTSSGEKTGYGFGWAIGKDKTGRAWVGHNGGSVGGTTRFRVYPKEQAVFVIIANMTNLKYGDTADKLADIFLSAE